MADEQRHSVEIMDPIPESRAASPTLPEPTHPPTRREGGMGLPSALKRTGTMPTIRDDAENNDRISTRRRGHSTSNSLHPVDTNGSRARAGSVSSSRHRKSVKIERTPTGFLGMRKRTTTWNLNGPTALGRQGTVRRRGTLNLGGASSAVDFGGDSQSQAGFTLAGPGNPLDTIIANQPYIDPGYADLNPAYEVAPNARPVWGLAKPLPHVVRPGMIPTKSEIRQQTPGQLQHEQQAREDFDLEAGRVESTVNPGKISDALRTAQQDREFKLLRTYTGQSAFGGNGHRKSSVSSAQGQQSLSERLHKIDQQQDAHSDRASQSISHTIRRLASVTEQSTPDEADHPDGRGWIMDDALAATPVDEKQDDEDWVEVSDDLKPYDPELDEIHNLHTHWSVIRLRFREPLAELLATTCQLTLGFCADLVVTCSKSSATVNTNWAWGLATMIGIYIAGGISGAHLNPAMSIMLWIYRGFPLRKIPSYAFAQVLGAFLAALISFGLFRTSIIAYADTTDLASTDTVSAFITYPRNSWVDPATAFFTEFVGTTILAVVVLALGDDSNAPPGAGMNAFIMGLVIAVLSMAFGYNTGLASESSPPPPPPTPTPYTSASPSMPPYSIDCGKCPKIPLPRAPQATHMPHQPLWTKMSDKTPPSESSARSRPTPRAPRTWVRHQVYFWLIVLVLGSVVRPHRGGAIRCVSVRLGDLCWRRESRQLPPPPDQARAQEEEEQVEPAIRGCRQRAAYRAAKVRE